MFVVQLNWVPVPVSHWRPLELCVSKTLKLRTMR
jgi:hypothetical protein